MDNNLLVGCLRHDETKSDSDQCLTCLSDFNSTGSTNGNFCCKLNYYYDSTLERCTKIEDENCATVNSNNVCTECFKTELRCMKSSLSFPYIANQFYLSNDKCVKLGQYYNGENIVDIELENCLKLQTSDSTCTECRANYLLQDGKCEYIKDCNSYVDADGNKYYLSNNHCC